MAVRSRLLSQADLVALVGDRVRPSMAAQSDELPYCVYSLVSETPVDHLTGYANLSNALIQVDVFTHYYQEAKAVAKQVKAAFRALRNTQIVSGAVTTDIRSAAIVGSRESVDAANDASDEHVYRVSVDLSINYREN